MLFLPDMGKPGKTPPALARLQAWFGKAISRPLPEAYPANPLALSAPEIGPEAEALIRGKNGLGGFARLGIYNQQYWFRLISIMQSEYPCAVHLLGLGPFNQWSVRYLDAHPPASPFLADLDAAFSAFLEREYRGPDREAVLQAVAYDRALSKAFDAPEGATLASAGLADPAALLSARLILAPHVTPLHVDWDFADYRARCMADESLEQALDPKPGSAHLVIFRSADLDVLTTPVSTAALGVLRAFREAATLTEAFARLEADLGPEDQAELEGGISAWFQDWVARGWLCLAGPDPAGAVPAEGGRADGASIDEEPSGNAPVGGAASLPI